MAFCTETWCGHTRSTTWQWETASKLPTDGWKRHWQNCMILHSRRGAKPKRNKIHSVYSTSPSSKVSVRGLHPNAMPGSGSVLSSVISSAVTHWYLATQQWHQVPEEKHTVHILHSHVHPHPHTHTHTSVPTKMIVPRWILDVKLAIKNKWSS